jgi:hypothetical protein
MNKIIGIAMLLVGGWLLYTGYNRGESLAGKTKAGIAELKNEIDGKARVPDHVWYYIGGGVLVLVGGGMLMRKS